MNSEKFNNSIWMLDRLYENNPREDSIGDKIGDAYTDVKNFVARNTDGVQHIHATAMTEEDYDSRMKSALSELKSETLELHAQMLNDGASPEDIERMERLARDVQKFEENYDEQKHNPELMKAQLAVLVNAASEARDGFQGTGVNFDEVDFTDIEIKPVEMPMYTTEPVTIDIDIDGDGIPEPVEIKPVDMPFQIADPSETNALGGDPDLIQQLPSTYYGMGGEDIGEPHFGIGGDNSDIPADVLVFFEAEAYTGDNSLALDAMKVVPMDEALLSNLQKLDQEQSDPQITIDKGLSL